MYVYCYCYYCSCFYHYDDYDDDFHSLESMLQLGLAGIVGTDLVSGHVLDFPSRSKDPNNRFLEPKYYRYYSIWALNPYYLGPWTLRVLWCVHPQIESRVP